MSRKARGIALSYILAIKYRKLMSHAKLACALDSTVQVIDNLSLNGSHMNLSRSAKDASQ